VHLEERGWQVSVKVLLEAHMSPGTDMCVTKIKKQLECLL